MIHADGETTSLKVGVQELQLPYEYSKLTLGFLYKRLAYVSDLEQYPIASEVCPAFFRIRQHLLVCCRPQSCGAICLGREEAGKFEGILGLVALPSARSFLRW